jgi:hypothetical protein
MKTFSEFISEKGKGLWYNIHQKRKRGEKMRKKGEKGAPTQDAIRKAQGEASERIPRKKGQHTGSSSHSDLYTDEDPKGTIKGLGFKDAATAKNGIAIINKSDRTHAHKVQATLVMQQRAKVAIGRTKDPEKKKDLEAAYKIWTVHLEKLKKITQQKKD